MGVKSSTKQQRRADTPEYYTARSEAVAAAAKQAGIDLVVLFGSTARGRLRTESNVDIAVRVVQGKPGFETEARVGGELHQALKPPRELDLVVLNRASPLLLANVAAERIVLYAAAPEIANVLPRLGAAVSKRLQLPACCQVLACDLPQQHSIGQ
jgi:predicted nucleotidyltransferase